MYTQLEFKNLLVAVDGSDHSRMSYEQSLEFLEQRKDQFDQLIITHITNREKTWLPEKFQAETIYDQYKLECLEKFQHNKYKLVFEEKSQLHSSCVEQILGLSERLQISFIFIGFYGRKGTEQQKLLANQGDQQKQIGSAADSSKQATKQVYKRSESVSQGFNFLVCVDGSNKSYKALNYALNLSQNPKDTITFCFAPTPDKKTFSKTISAQLTEILELVKHINSRFMVLCPSYIPADQIVKFVSDQLALPSIIHFVIIGNDGYRAQLENKTFFGTTAEIIVSQAQANIIIVT